MKREDGVKMKEAEEEDQPPTKTRGRVKVKGEEAGEE